MKYIQYLAGPQANLFAHGNQIPASVLPFQPEIDGGNAISTSQALHYRSQLVSNLGFQEIRAAGEGYVGDIPGDFGQAHTELLYRITGVRFKNGEPEAVFRPLLRAHLSCIRKVNRRPCRDLFDKRPFRSEEHTSELQSR